MQLLCLDIIHRLVFIYINVSEIGFCLHLQVERTTALQEEQQTLLDTPENGQLGQNM
jgi:hypothetical protein